MLSGGKSAMAPLVLTLNSHLASVHHGCVLVVPARPIFYSRAMIATHVLRAGLYVSCPTSQYSPRSSHVRIMTADPDLEAEVRFPGEAALSYPSCGKEGGKGV
jgi:hypothetical protein